MNQNLTDVAIFSPKVMTDLVEEIVILKEIAILEYVVTDLAVEITIQRRSRWKLTNQRMSQPPAVKDRSSQPKESRVGGGNRMKSDKISLSST
ncbi:hypothetical protein TIFTF001_016164 [Ficus carica]|uniref:Uncharacterized protein n=1 Tax=Ficus carica TaxID=3494 RepID=A0AA88A8G8_FICCA|nr:hypothetical protein TIFTF001_016164 [Ficus carica]